jgi:hypothetical protein
MQGLSLFGVALARMLAMHTAADCIGLIQSWRWHHLNDSVIVSAAINCPHTKSLRCQCDFFAAAAAATLSVAPSGGVQNSAGVVGVCPRGLKMISAKFLTARGGSTSGAVAALNYLLGLRQRYGLQMVATSNSW